MRPKTFSFVSTTHSLQVSTSSLWRKENITNSSAFIDTTDPGAVGSHRLSSFPHNLDRYSGWHPLHSRPTNSSNRAPPVPTLSAAPPNAYQAPAHSEHNETHVIHLRHCCQRSVHLCPLHVHTSKKHSSLSSICALLELGAPCGSLPSTWIASHCFTRLRSERRRSSRDPQDSTKRVQSPRSIGSWFASYNCACCSRSPSASAPMRRLLTRLRPTPKSVSCAAHFMSCCEKCSPAPVARH